jgi:glyoxylase-like metal-dependent hydrolase (beta-lactamase superfamily II)
MKTKRWALASVSAAALAAQLYAQGPTPQIPVYNFRSPEDTRKFGMKPEDIKAGVKPDFSRIREQLVVVPVRGQVHLVGGGGGNIAMQVGDEGVLLVDSGVGPAAERVIAAYKGATEMPLRWIINTSVDADHIGGNAAVAATGLPGNGGGPGGGGGGPGGFGGGGGGNPANQVQAASIVAHESVLNRMNATEGTPQAIPVAAWPTSAFFTPKKTMYFNGEPIEMLHLPAAHSDGDVLVHFRSSDVIAAGDAYSNDRFPQFDPARGGSIQGSIEALNRIIDITVAAYNMQGGTLVVPGHGRIANEADVVEYRDSMTIVRDRIKEMAEKKMTLAQVKAAKPVFDYERIYAHPSWTADLFIEAVYTEFSRPATARGATR